MKGSVEIPKPEEEVKISIPVFFCFEIERIDEFVGRN